MKRTLGILMVALLCTTPTVAMAKKAPIINTGDEIFVIKGAEALPEGFQLGYMCQHFGIFWADVWTWNCNMMAVKPEASMVAELPADLKAKYAGKYTESDRERSIWEHYGIFMMLALGIAYGLYSRNTD